MPRRFEIIHHRGQRLVQLVRHGRGHLAHYAEARGVQQLGLEILDTALRRLLLGQVADKAGEKTLSGETELADLQLHRKGLTALAQAHDDPADADDAALAGPQIAVEIGIVPFPIRRRHQNADVVAGDFGAGIAEQPLGGGAE